MHCIPLRDLCTNKYRQITEKHVKLKFVCFIGHDEYEYLGGVSGISKMFPIAHFSFQQILVRDKYMPPCMSKCHIL